MGSPRAGNGPDNPARLSLAADWRVFGFGLALTFATTLLFGLAPALRASAVRPASALRGGENPHSRGRLMHALIADVRIDKSFHAQKVQSTSDSHAKRLDIRDFQVAFVAAEKMAQWSRVAEHQIRRLVFLQDL